VEKSQFSDLSKKILWRKFLETEIVYVLEFAVLSDVPHASTSEGNRAGKLA
jgi:hypothetical protein